MNNNGYDEKSITNLPKDINFELINEIKNKHFILVENSTDNKQLVFIKPAKTLAIVPQNKKYNALGKVNIKRLPYAVPACYKSVIFVPKEIVRREITPPQTQNAKNDNSRFIKILSNIAIAVMIISVLAFSIFFVSGLDNGITVAKKGVPTVVQIKTNGELASGVMIVQKGDKTYILTNYHVIRNVLLNGGDIRVYQWNNIDELDFCTAEIVAYDETNDIALLAIKKTGYKLAKMVTGNVVVQFGQTVYAIGNANGDGISITKGIVSQPSIKFPETSGENTTFTQTAIKVDAPINKGASGGGLFNKKGQLVGIIFAYKSPSNNESVGFVLSVQVAYNWAKEYIV